MTSRWTGSFDYLIPEPLRLLVETGSRGEVLFRSRNATGFVVGFKEFRIFADIDADMTAEEKEAFVHEVDKRGPVSFNLLNGAPLKISAI